MSVVVNALLAMILADTFIELLAVAARAGVGSVGSVGADPRNVADSSQNVTRDTIRVSPTLRAISRASMAETMSDDVVLETASMPFLSWTFGLVNTDDSSRTASVTEIRFFLTSTCPDGLVEIDLKLSVSQGDLCKASFALFPAHFGGRDLVWIMVESLTSNVQSHFATAARLEIQRSTVLSSVLIRASCSCSRTRILACPSKVIHSAS